MHGANAASLTLPPDWNLHPVFHVSLLKPFVARPDDSPSSYTIPLPSVIDGLPSYQVEEILAHRDRSVGRKRVREYLVQWSGQGPEHNSWILSDSLPSPLIESYSRSALSQRGGNCSTSDAPEPHMTRSRTRLIST